MGNDLRHKGLLLDEADFALPLDCNMETLSQAVADYCAAEFVNEFDDPSLEIFGIASEGLGETSAFDSQKAVWIKSDIGFRDIFLRIAGKLGISEPLAAEAVETGHVDHIETHLNDRIKTHLEACDYRHAEELLQYMPQLRSVGLPGVEEAREFDTRGEDMIVDFRVNNYGPGRRILVEIAFNWGQ